MSKLNVENRAGSEYRKSDWSSILRTITAQVNSLAEGRLAARYNAQSSVPGAGTYAKGDFVPDSNCTVSGGTVRLGWVCTADGSPGTFQEARVLVANFGQLANSLGADVALNNTSNYFDGPSVSQGTSGTWLAFGNVTVTDGTSARIVAKLWDGTTVIDSAEQDIPVAGDIQSISLSGVITSPAANIRISVRDISTTGGSIKFNASGNSKDSTLTVVRIG